MGEDPKKRNTLTPTPSLEPITPELIDKHLTQPYKDTWHDLINGGFFTKEEFCALINEVRKLRIKNQELITQKMQKLEELQTQQSLTTEQAKQMKEFQDKKDDVMKEAINEIFSYVISRRIESSGIEPKSVYQLIGSVLHIPEKEKKEREEYIEFSKEDLYTVLLDAVTQNYIDEIVTTAEKMEAEYNIGGEINENEKKNFVEQAISAFKHNHDAEIQNGTIDIQKIIKYLNQKDII